jgi:cytochrome b561
MPGPPSYPDTGSTSQGTGPPGRGPHAGRPRWQTAAIAAIVIALLAVMLILHLTGTFGPGAHG